MGRGEERRVKGKMTRIVMYDWNTRVLGEAKAPTLMGGQLIIWANKYTTMLDTRLERFAL